MLTLNRRYAQPIAYRDRLSQRDPISEIIAENCTLRQAYQISKAYL
jgi:hypothetical protein